MTVTSTHGHTYRDAAAMTAAGINPADTQPREHAVPCAVCHTDTWNVGGRCDDHVYPLDRVDFDSFAATFAQMGDVDTLQLVATLNHQLHHRGALYRFRLVTVDPT